MDQVNDHIEEDTHMNDITADTPEKIKKKAEGDSEVSDVCYYIKYIVVYLFTKTSRLYLLSIE